MALYKTGGGGTLEDYEIVAVRGASSAAVTCEVGDYIFGINTAFKNIGYNITGGTILQIYPMQTSGSTGPKSLLAVATSTSVTITGATSGGSTNPHPFLIVLRKK